VSIFFAIIKKDHIHAFADTATFKVGGNKRISHFESKIKYFANMPAIVGGLGNTEMIKIVHGCFELASDFDFMTDRLASLIDEFAPSLDQMLRHIYEKHYSVYVAGWSKRANRPELWLWNTQARKWPMVLDARKFQYYDGTNYFDPVPSFKYLKKQNYDFPSRYKHFDPAFDGVILAESLRRSACWKDEAGKPFFGCGGQLEHTQITKDGAKTQTIHHWPEDEIGKEIQPIGD